MIAPEPYSGDDFPPYPDLDAAESFGSREAAIGHLSNTARRRTAEGLFGYSYSVEEISHDTVRLRAVSDRSPETVFEYTVRSIIFHK
jgi:hypothetical protein